MESRLKERLTGAAILVALIVLIVPEIFHDRRSASTPTGVTPVVTAVAPAATRSIPSRSVTIELAPRPAATVPPPADESRPPAGAAPVAQAARAKHVAAPVASRPPTPARQDVAAVPAKARGPANSRVPAKARVASLAAGGARGGGWTVQLGLFAKQANAERLAHTAQSHGFAVQISRFGQKGLYRVAVAGVADRAAAEQLARRVRDAGLSAAILGPR